MSILDEERIGERVYHREGDRMENQQQPRQRNSFDKILRKRFGNVKSTPWVQPPGPPSVFLGTMLLIIWIAFNIHSHFHFLQSIAGNRSQQQVELQTHKFSFLSHPSHHHNHRGNIPSSSSSSSSSLGGHKNNNNRVLCSGHRRSLLAPASYDPKVPHATRVEFVRLGLYEQIAKGSGVIHAAGAILETLSQLQTYRLHLFGTVGELGIHHGRFTSFLYLTARRSETLLAVDLFENLQQSNLDLSGLGDFKMFARGLRLYDLDVKKDVQVFQMSTTDLPMDFGREIPGLRLVSIDAGHTAELTKHDLQLVFCNLLPGGIVLLDDWFHPHWPGVVEGFYQFLQVANLSDFGVYPFLFCEGKLYITNDQKAHDFYLQSLLDDTVLSEWMTEHARVAQRRAGQTWPYQMAQGTHYARCDRDLLPSPEKARSVWVKRLLEDRDANKEANKKKKKKTTTMKKKDTPDTIPKMHSRQQQQQQQPALE